MASPPPTKRARTLCSTLTVSSSRASPECATCNVNVQQQLSGGGEKAAPRAPKVKAMTNFFNKLKSKRIYVNTRSDIPSKVWFLKKGAPAKRGDEYDIIQEMSGLPAWVLQCRERFVSSVPGQHVENEYMDNMTLVFDQIAKSLKWNDNKEEWNVDDKEAEVYDQLLEELKEKNELLVHILEAGNLFRALARGLTNAQGRAAITSVLFTACKTAFGRDSNKLLDVINVGSSRAKGESFPVDVVLSSREAFEQSYVFRENVSSSGTSSLQGGECDSNDPEDLDDNFKEIYTDIMVITCDNPALPYCIFVSEIKSEALNRNQKGQVICQMLAPMMHQDICFGLLMSPKEAYLYHMQRDPTNTSKKRRIKLYCNYYQFTYPAGGSVFFWGKQLLSMFIDIAASLYYAKNNVKEFVCNPDPPCKSDDVQLSCE